jgi:hypothetical protein
MDNVLAVPDLGHPEHLLLCLMQCAENRREYLC